MTRYLLGALVAMLLALNAPTQGDPHIFGSSGLLSSEKHDIAYDVSDSGVFVGQDESGYYEWTATVEYLGGFWLFHDVVCKKNGITVYEASGGEAWLDGFGSYRDLEAMLGDEDGEFSAEGSCDNP